MFQVTTFEPRTLIWWYNKIDEIDFTPSYQRKSGRWSKQDQAYLIDSIINGFDIPKIYLTDFTFLNTRLNTANRPYAVIDGKQRLESIMGFIDGRVLLNDNIRYYKDISLNLGGLSYSDIKISYPKIASEFDNYNLTVMRVITDDDSMINQLFIRLNSNQKLTGAELRNAMGGPVVKAIHSISEHYFFKNSIAFNTKKGEDDNLAAKLLYIEFVGDFTDTKRIHLDRFVAQAIQSESYVYDKVAEHVLDVLGTMANVFSSRDALLKSQGDIPVYYWIFRNLKTNYSLAYGLIRHFNEARIYIADTNKYSSYIIQDFPISLMNEYNFFRRSTNDQRSLRGRYDILMKFLTNELPRETFK